MDQVERRLNSMKWAYDDNVARAGLARRIAAVGRAPDDFLTYTQLVEGVTFCMANVNRGRPFEIRQWNNLERSIIGSLLGQISAESYRAGRFFASALVIGAGTNGPGEGFYELAEQTGLMALTSEYARLKFWLDHVDCARRWYRAHAD